MSVDNQTERMNIVITGHVDHGKSTLVGRLLADTFALPEGKLQAVKDNCKKNGRVFEYAFLLDALDDEQKQGITIDSARIFFKSAVREYIIIDAPGHIEFLRNMLSGASRASAAVLVIDAVEGVAENSKRHGLLLSLLGISQVIIAVNKLDMLGYDEKVFNRIKKEYSEYLSTLKVVPSAFIPVSAREGKNITKPALEMPWYTGKTILQALDSFTNLRGDEDSFFAMPLQDVYRFSDDDDERRIYAGSVVSGAIQIGEKIKFLPSNKTAHIVGIETWNAPPKTKVLSGEAAGFTLQEEIYVKRGEVMVKADTAQQVCVSTKLRANIIWLGEAPFVRGKDYTFKLGAAKLPVRLERIERLVGEASKDAAHNANPECVRRHECACVVLSLSHLLAFTPFAENASLGRFVLVDGYDAAGGGIVLENVSEESSVVNSSRTVDGEFVDELFALLKKYFPERF